MTRFQLLDDELDVLLALADGETMRDIAAGLDVSAATVQKRIGMLRVLFGAKTTAHLVALAYHRGLLVAPR